MACVPPTAAWLALRGASAGGFVLSLHTWPNHVASPVPPGVSCPAWFLLVFVDTMANRDHSKSRSPVHATRRDAGRLSQASTVAASSQLDALMLAPTPARGDFHSEWPPDGQQPPGTSSQVSATPVSPSPFAHVGGPTYRGVPPTPAPAPVSGPSPTVHLVNTDPFARARIAAVQSRVAAPVVSDPRPPPHVPAFSPFRDGHFWCSKCPRRGFTTIPGLMRHVTHQHAGSTVDEATCSLFTAIERVTCTAPACGGLRRVGARVCNRCGQASQARPGLPGWVTSLWAPLARLPAVRTRLWSTLTSMSHPVSPLIYLPLTCRATSRSASARFPHTPFCTFLPAAACA